MHEYRFVFHSDKEPEHQGLIIFPKNLVPYIPLVGDQVSFETLDKENVVHGTVSNRKFRCEFDDSQNEILANRTFVHFEVKEEELISLYH